MTQPDAIDIHAHLIPEAVVNELRGTSSAFPSVQVEETSEGLSFRFPSLQTSPTAPRKICDPDNTARWLRDQNIDAQIFSVWTDLFGYTLPAGEASDWCRFLNEEAVRLAAQYPELHPMAAVPLAHPGAAVAELELAKAEGCRGVMIGTAVPGADLDDERFEEFWRAASSLQMPVFLHPIFLARDPRLRDYGLANAVGRSNETVVAVARLLYAGVPLRHEDLQLVVPHGGAAVTALMGRLRRNHERSGKIFADPIEGLSHLYFDSIVLDPRLLRSLLGLVEPTQVLLGSDFPFDWEPSPRLAVESAQLDSAVVKAILVGNAQRLYGL